MTVQVPLVESYSSALAIGGEGKVISSPPATSTMPLGNKVAVFADRPLFRLPVRVQLPLTGSYSSALARMPLLVLPPATRAMPLVSNVAFLTVRAVFRLPGGSNYHSPDHRVPHSRVRGSCYQIPLQQAPYHWIATSPCDSRVPYSGCQ